MSPRSSCQQLEANSIMAPTNTATTGSPGPPPEYTPVGMSQQPVLTSTQQLSNSSTSNHHNHGHQHRHRHIRRTSRDYPLTTRLSLMTSRRQSPSRHPNRLLYHSPHLSLSHQSSSSHEKSPFLIVKILLFSLMAIDFVMNTIGLAVIIVIVKNHYNNFIVERSFIIRSEFMAAAHHHLTGDSPIQNPIDSQAQSEWSLLLPLLPSFIFAEILTLIGMFGVFCDLFSFTMTYAILKLITSLCYPSMASVAAVAAMAAATTSSISNPMMPPPISVNNIVNNNITTDLVPIILPFQDMLNDTASVPPESRPANVFFDYHDGSHKLPASSHENGSIFLMMSTLSPYRPPSASLTTPTTPIFLIRNSQESNDFSISSNNSNSGSTIFTSTTTPSSHVSTIQPNDNNSSPIERQQVMSKISITVSPMSMMKSRQREQQTIAKNNPGWLKNYEINISNKDFRQMKKSDRLAKLKAREKQLKNRLLKLETLETSNQIQNQTSLPLIFLNNSSKQTRTQSWVLDGQPQSMSSLNNNQQFRLLLPLDSQQQHPHNIKYHHRVWDALLVTFEVIFAVTFAFNLLSNEREDDGHNYHHRSSSMEDGQFLDMGFDLNDSLESNGSSFRYSLVHRRRRYRTSSYYYHRNHRHNQNLWPYSPLATSIDAFYFAYFRLPPPPPPYFCHRNTIVRSAASSDHHYHHHQQHSSNSPHHLPPRPTSSSNNSRRNRHLNHHHLAVRSLFDGQNLRRCLTSSWLLDRRNNFNNNNNPSTQQRSNHNNNRINQLDPDSTTVSIPPPQYEDIGRDNPINFIMIPVQQPDETAVRIASTTLNNNQQHLSSSNICAQTSNCPERIVQMINPNNDNSESVLIQEQQRFDNEQTILPTIIEVVIEDEDEDHNDHHSIHMEQLEEPRDYNIVEIKANNNNHLEENNSSRNDDDHRQQQTIDTRV